MEKEPRSSPGRSSQRPFNAYAEYSGLAIQMMVVILVGVFGGIKLDRFTDLSFPVFTVGLTVIAVIISMVMVVLKVMRK